MAVKIRLSEGLDFAPEKEISLADTPRDIGALLAELERRYPGAKAALDSSSVNAAVNGDLILSGRDPTVLHDGDEVEFLIMFAGG